VSDSIPTQYIIMRMAFAGNARRHNKKTQSLTFTIMKE